VATVRSGEPSGLPCVLLKMSKRIKQRTKIKLPLEFTVVTLRTLLKLFMEINGIYCECKTERLSTLRGEK
jgi:hypothetical protein